MAISRLSSIEILELVSLGTAATHDISETIKLRKKALRNMVLEEKGFKKVAFDSRRIDQEEEYNPRRGLQHYQRTENFVRAEVKSKLEKLLKIHEALIELKQEYGKQSEWLDSNARILLSALDNGLRIKQGDGDFSETQKSVGGLNYIEELLYVRYRLAYNDIQNMTKEDIKRIILSKDEPLSKQSIYNSAICAKLNEKTEIVKTAPNDMLQQLIGEVRATAENPTVERTITITIRDAIQGSKIIGG